MYTKEPSQKDHSDGRVGQESAIALRNVGLFLFPPLMYSMLIFLSSSGNSPTQDAPHSSNEYEPLVGVFSI